MRRTGILLAALFVLAASGCAPQVDVEAERAAIREADAEAWKAFAAKDVDSFLSIFADNASQLPADAPIITGKEAIREHTPELFATPGFAVLWEPREAEVSRAGDLGYTSDNFQITVNDAQGNPVAERGKHLAIWKKQPDGSWKVVVAIWNSDGPPASE